MLTKKIKYLLGITVIIIFLLYPVQFIKGADVKDEKQTESITDSNQKESVSEDQIYGIGSISKMYTTAAIMKLKEEGRIDLDEPLTTYLPEFSMQDERYKLITPRMLLNHSSGLMGTTAHDSFTFGGSDLRYHDSILEKLKTQKLKADPGSYGVYCNDGFTLAELLIERVSGLSYSEYLDQTFFKPLEMKDTFTPVYHFDDSRLAKTYIGDSVLPFVDCHLLGSGGIYSTASDVAKFGQLFTRNGGDNVLSENTLDEMSQSNSSRDSICYQKGDKQFDFGLGWDCVDTYPYSAYGIKALSKGGSIIFQNSALVVLPDENISASMIVSGGSGDEASYALQDLILEVLKEEGVIDEKKDLSVRINQKPDIQPLPEDLKEYAGKYLSNQILNVSFSEDGELLLDNLQDDYSIEQKYAYIGDGKFAPLNGAYLGHTGTLTYNSNGNKGYGTLSFKKESNGKTYLAGNSYETIYGLGENAINMAFAEKIEPVELDNQIMQKWQERDGKLFFLTDSVYNSWNFYSEGIVQLRCNRESDGYVHTDKNNDIAAIQSENYAYNHVNLPIMLGRDLAEYQFEKDTEGEKLKISSLSYLPEDDVKEVDQMPEDITMKENEGVFWYKVTPAYAGKSVLIKTPESGAYYIYNSKRECVASSIMLDDSVSILLPSDGYIVFAGEKENSFHIKFDKQ